MYHYNRVHIVNKNLKKHAGKFIGKSQSTFNVCNNTIPRPKSLPIVGTRLDLLAAGSGKNLHKYIDNRHKQLGPIFAENLNGNTELIFISDPELIKSLFIKLEGKYPTHILPEPWILYEQLYGSKRGLFFMNGEEWLQNRRILNKCLLKDGAEKWIRQPVVETVDSFITLLKAKCSNGFLFEDMEAELYKLSTSVIVNVLLGPNALRYSQHHEELLSMFAVSVKKIFQTTTKLYAWPLYWCHLFNLKVWRDFTECVHLTLSLANKMAQEMLENKNKSNGLVKQMVDENIKSEDIIRIIADFIIAAGDTTAYTTLWILFLLSRNKDVVADIRLNKSDYIKCVIKEGMRLYPVAPFLTRILPKETLLGNYKINDKTPIIASIYTSGRDDNNFSKAQLFLPYRWDRNDSRKASLVNHVPTASLPFAMGARSCIGKKIAMLQLTEVIGQIVKTFDFQCTNITNINTITSQVLIPDKHIDFYFTLRSNIE